MSCLPGRLRRSVGKGSEGQLVESGEGLGKGVGPVRPLQGGGMCTGQGRPAHEGVLRIALRDREGTCPPGEKCQEEEVGMG